MRKKVFLNTASIHLEPRTVEDLKIKTNRINNLNIIKHHVFFKRCGNIAFLLQRTTAF